MQHAMHDSVRKLYRSSGLTIYYTYVYVCKCQGSELADFVAHGRARGDVYVEMYTRTVQYYSSHA